MMLALALLSTVAQAGAERLSLSFGLAGFGAPDLRRTEPVSGGVLGAGYFSVRALDWMSVDLGGRTGVLLGPAREATGINVSGRFFLQEKLFIRTGFVHQHETLLEDFIAAPVAALFGSAEAIGHRSGFELGAGVRAPLQAVSTSGVAVGLTGLGTWFPDQAGPRFYGVVEAMLTIDLGKPKA